MGFGIGVEFNEAAATDYPVPGLGNAALRSPRRLMDQLVGFVMTVPPPKDWDIRFGLNLIEQHCGSMDDYVAVTSPSAFAAVKPQLLHDPIGVFYVTILGPVCCRRVGELGDRTRRPVYGRPGHSRAPRARRDRRYCGVSL